MSARTATVTKKRDGEYLYVGDGLRDALVEDLGAYAWEDRQAQADKIKSALQTAAPHRGGFLFDTEGWSWQDIDFLRDILSSVEETYGHTASSRGIGFGNTRLGRQIRALREKL